MIIDTTTAFGERVVRRLNDEAIIWLTTVRADGTPQPSPVWFVWDGTELLIYSQPKTQKLRNIARNPRVSLHFDGNGTGGDIVIITGTARLAPDAPPADALPAYTTKYGERIKGIGMEPRHFALGYSVAIRVMPESLRGF
jgi:PPOX class probable F420-dependent enzyme